MDEIKTTEQKPRRSSRKRDPVCEHLSFAAKEAFKRLRTNLAMSFPDGDADCKIVGVTSAQPSAAAFATAGKTALIQSTRKNAKHRIEIPHRR